MLNIKDVKIGFIGYGNMSGATAKGLMQSGAIEPSQVYACAKNYDKLEAKANAQGINPCKTAAEVINACDVIFIGVKPYLVETVINPVKDLLKGKLVISLAANILGEQLQKLMPDVHVLYTAPNTPVAVCEGIFLLEESNNLTEEEKDFTAALLENIALVLWIDSAHIKTAGALAGCTPAFTSMYIEALGDAGCKHGLTRKQAYSLAAQVLVGTGKLALTTGDHPGAMKDAVCSPAGITIVGVSTLEKNNFRYSVIDAIDEIHNKMNGGK